MSHRAPLCCSPYSTVPHLGWHLTFACRLWCACVRACIQTHSNAQPQPLTAWIHKRATAARNVNCKLATHKDKYTNRWLACEGVWCLQIFALHNSSSTCHPHWTLPPVLLQNTRAHTHALTGTLVNELTVDEKVAGESGIGSVCASCLPTAPLGLVKFDLMAFPVN